MATASKAAPKSAKPNEHAYSWEGKDKNGKTVKGEMRAAGEASVSAYLRRQGIQATKIKRSRKSGKAITEKDIALFTRQLATMLKSGVPLLQAFDIVGKGHNNPSVARMIMDIKTDVETGSSLEMAFRKFPLYFDDLYCNLIGAGEAAGILDNLLDKIATYKEKILAIKSKIKSALFYPVSIIVIAFVITAVIMIFVIPAFKTLFASFGADLPTPTLVIMGISDWFVKWWWAIFSVIGGGLYTFF
ncbi:MAG TPA: type II secretion system F family protein, partial [Gallionellaceae bacterium]|nr:type II secretion system F family protein [Gallionellaceae bacterium]